ncbi:MAG: hypothetical protein JSW72_03715 [Candidatus Bathyarchaeota archaeon]|nr:MAG: hypothetical protein JSW72_03715 [Candidatus Bathyarchaeota archaeon]
MSVRKRVSSLLAICILLFSFLTSINLNHSASANPNGFANLPGGFFDSGKDTDADGKFNYLEVAVEINVSVAGHYILEADGLVDQYDSWLNFFTSSEGYLNLGAQYLNLSFSGIAIYAERFSPKNISRITLYDQHYDYLGEITDAELSRIYDFTEFDIGASMTGNMSSEGIDTDSDGLFNTLQVGVEINVTDPATYEVHIWNLYGDVSIYVGNQSAEYLLPGIHTLNISLYGAKIYAARGNISMIYEIQLSILEGYQNYLLDSLYNVPLSAIYGYYEFDPLALLTSTILDEGVDDDGDGLFDYLQISVEVNVTDAGYYSIFVDRISDNKSGYIWISSGIGQNFDVGMHLVNFTVLGVRIYAEQLDPTYVGPVRLYDISTWEDILLEEHYMLPLATLYHYYEFESQAFFTDNIYDRGVDTDSDGLFDYLEVGVEINVTEAGTYILSGGGLAEKLDNYTRSIYFPSQQFIVDLDLGIHTINFTFSGPMIAYNHFSPTDITDIRLREYSTYYQLGYISTAALSTTYNHIKFDSPFSDTQIELIVYPNATVGLSGLVNQTNIYSPYYSPLVNATLDFSTLGDLTAGSLNGTMLLPEYPNQYDQFPYNSTTANLLSEYNNGMLNAQLNTTVHIPMFEGTDWMGRPIIPIQLNSSDFSFLATYSNGILDLDLHGTAKMYPYYGSQFPFNVTDVTVLVDYVDNEIGGNITFHTVSGFPLSDVIVYFSGSKTEVSFTGHIDVMYGNYYGMEINATTLEEILTEFNNTIPSRGDYSLYNITDGAIECTALSTTKTPIDAIGAKINYNATLHGNFTDLMTTYLSQMLFGPYAPEEAFSVVYTALDAALSSVRSGSLELNYWHSSHVASVDLSLSCDVEAFWNQTLQSIPPIIPPEYTTQVGAWLKIANATAYALESFSIEAEYINAIRQLDLSASLTANVSKLKNEIITILPDAGPPMLRDLVESCTNTTYCTLKSLNISCNYIDTSTIFEVEWLLENDFKSELNHLKDCYIEYLNLSSPYMINWQMRMLNVTVIDIGNLKAEIRQGSDWTILEFENLKLHPAIDEIDQIRFALYNWLQMTSEASTPREFERLKISILGGFNATNAILLHAPSSVPTPDTTSLDYRNMIWENVSTSSLKNLLFQIAFQGVVDYLGQTYYIPIFTNSTMSNFNFSPTSKSISFNASGNTGTGFLNITIPRALLYAAPTEWIVAIDGIPLALEEFTLTENDEYVFIYLNYSHSSHLIEIMGTWIISEFPPSILPLITLISLTAAVIFAIKQRKKIRKLKAKYQHAIAALARSRDNSTFFQLSIMYTTLLAVLMHRRRT